MALDIDFDNACAQSRAGSLPMLITVLRVAGPRGRSAKRKSGKTMQPYYAKQTNKSFQLTMARARKAKEEREAQARMAAESEPQEPSITLPEVPCQKAFAALCP